MEHLDPDPQLELNRIQLKHTKQQLELNRIQLKHTKQQLELDRIQLEHTKLHQEHTKLHQELKYMKRMLIKEAERHAGNANAKLPGLQRNQSRSCVSCGEQAEEFCSRCGHTPYCSARCQRRDWAERHKDVCHNLATLPDNFNVEELAANEPAVRPAAPLPWARARSPPARDHSKDFFNENEYPKIHIEDTDSDGEHGREKEHIETPAPAAGPHCERSALRFASQEAFDDHKTCSTNLADKRTIKTTPTPMVVNGVQFAKTLRVELWKYYAPPEYAPLFGAPLKRPKANALKEKNNGKASNEESVTTVNSDANIQELSKNTQHLEEDATDYTETALGDENSSLRKTSKDFICNDCGRQFHKKISIITHIKTKHLKYIDTRFEKFSTKDRLEKDSKLNYEKSRYICDVCNTTFTSKFLLLRHKQGCDIKNNVSNTHTTVKPYLCTKCGKTFNHKHDFKRHTHTGEKANTCTVCNKQFRNSTYIKIHMRTHTGEKPFSCNFCYKQFSLNSNLIAHMRTHTDEKSFSCTVCKKQFTQSCLLDRHMRTHTGEKPYACTVCNKQFSEKGHLNRHMRTHTGEKPHSCTVCRKKFSESGNLNKHMRSHTGEKPFSCILCNKKFSLNHNLTAHMRTHTGEKPHSCTGVHETILSK